MPMTLEGQGRSSQGIGSASDIRIEEVVGREGDTQIPYLFTQRGIYPPLRLHPIESIHQRTIVSHTEVGRPSCREAKAMRMLYVVRLEGLAIVCHIDTSPIPLTLGSQKVEAIQLTSPW